MFADGRQVDVHSDWKPGDLLWRGSVDGAEIAVQTRAILNGYRLAHAGVGVDARVYTRREAQLAALMIERKGADGSKSLLCPMPGLVKSIAVKVGQEVKAGEQLCIVEAMKMENVLCAERDATVKAILCQGGRFAGGRRGDHGVRVTRVPDAASSRPARRSSAAYGYSRAVISGDEVHISGTTGYDYARMAMPDDPAEQARNIYRDLRGGSEASGRNARRHRPAEDLRHRRSPIARR